MLDYGWKRLFSGLLAVTLVAGMLPPVTVAAEETDATEIMEVLETEPAITEPVITEPVETTAATEAVTELAETTVATEETVPETTAETVAETTEATLPENVAAVQVLIDALPDVDSVTAEDYEAVQAAFDAYEVLTEEEKALIQGAEVFEGLFGWFNAQVSTLDTLEWGMLDGGVMTINGTGTIPNYASADSTPWYVDRLSVTKVIIGDGITAIGDHAFDGFHNLASITIPDSVTAIGEKAFYECSVLKDMSIPEKVTTIGDAAFAYCKNLTDVTIPKDVTSIGNNVFYMCTGLTSVVIPDGVTSIGRNAFMNCTFLASVTIPASVTSIGNQAFDLCNSLTDVYYTGTQAQWEAVAIGAGNTRLNAAAMHYEYTGSNIIASGTCGKNLAWTLTDTGLLTISGTGDMDTVTSYHDSPYNGYLSTITTVVIESGVTSVGVRAFTSCSSLTSVTIPASVTSIGTGSNCDSFENCNKLAKITVAEGNQNYASVDGILYNIEKTEFLKIPACVAGSVTIPSGITRIPNMAFEGRTGLTGISIPAGVTNIGYSAFKGCTGLTSVAVPEGVTSIGSSAFQGCTGLTSVTLPEGLTAIEYNTFYSCSNLTGITIPASVTQIGSYAFYKCEKLTSVTLPKGITTVDSGTFQDCDKLESVYIPEGVTSISGEAFSGCNSLTDISIPDSVTSIGEKAFYNCYSMKIDTFPKNLTRIGAYAFSGCNCLKSVVLPEGLTTICDYAFGWCSGLTSVTLPASITSIGDKAFYDCKKLTDVYYTGTEDQWNGITIGTDNTYLTDATKQYNYTLPSSVIQGRCGDGLTWKLDATGELSIAGVGDMEEYTSGGWVPWDMYRNSITSVKIRYGVGSIGNYAFRNCSNLTSVTIAKSVTSIGERAFYYCDKLTSVTLPDGITSIGKEAFHLCGSLTSVNIPKSLTTAGDYAFANCSNLTSVTLPDGLTTIGDYMFNWCSNLTSVRFPASITSIGEAAFVGCYGLTSVTLPEGLTTIAPCAFQRCKNLSKITIPKSVTSIGSYALSYCDKLTSVTIPEGVTSIGSGAFAGCSALTSINIPKNVTSIGQYAFSECKALTSIVIPNGVTSIEGGTFYNCEDLVSVTIPDGITSIGEKAFYNCTWTKGITIPEGVTSIGDYAFYDCWYLTDVTIPEGVTSIGRFTFYGCSKVKSITIPEGITSIGESAFHNSGLTNITIPANVTSIGKNAFASCSSLTSVTISEGVTSIGERAFAGCNKLTTITVPASVTSVGDRAFNNCRELKEILVAAGNENYTSSGDILFDKNLKIISVRLGITGHVTLPNGMTSIRDSAFEECRSLTGITIPDSVTSIEKGAFYNCTSLSSITIPDGVTSIDDIAFSGCDSLTSFTFPSGIKTIEAYMFYGCNNLASITIPASVTRIDSFAFSYCNSLMDVYYAGSMNQWESVYISSTAGSPLTNATIHCTDGIINERAVPEIRPTEKVQLLSGNSKQFSAYDSKTGNKITVTWKVTKGAEYATITADGKLTAKNVTQARTVTISATDSAGGTGTKTITILPKATSVTVSGAGDTPLDMKTANVRLTATTYPEDALDDVKWSTSDKTIATVDETGLVTLLKPGTVTIKVTTTDGSNKSSSVKLTVYYVDTATKLTATAEVPTIGLQPGQTAKITVTGSKELPQDKLSFSIPANQQHIATVDENTGIVTAGTTPGTVTVTATLRDDPLKRTATVKIKVIDMQAASLEVSADVPEETAKFEENTVILDALTVKDNAYTFTVSATGKNHKDEPFTPAVTWASSNTAIATVKTDKDGITTVTVKKGAGGECAITATAKDLGKASANLWLSVRDYQPRLESSSLSMNLYQSSIVKTALLESYKNDITDVSIDGDFTASWADGILTIAAQEGVKKGTYTQTLTVTCSDGETSKEYEYTLKIKVTETAPTVTIKQSGKYNLFYNNGTAILNITAKGGEVERVTVLEGDFHGAYENGVLTLTCNGVANPSKKVTLEIQVAGYEKPVEKTVTLATVTTAPKLKLSSASSIINTILGEKSTTFQVLSDGNVLDLAESDVSYSVSFANCTVANNAIILTLNDTKGGTATLNIQKSNWTKSVKLTHKVTVQTALPTLKLGATTLKLNKVFTELGAQTTVILSQGNLTLSNLEITSTAKEGTALAAEAEKLSVNWDGENDITATIEDSSIKTGTYSYTCVGTLGTGEELKPVTLKITVSSTSPKVKLASTTLKLNRYLAGQEQVSTKVTVPAGYTLAGFDGLEDTPLTYADGYLTACLEDESSTGGSYTIYPIVIPAGGTDEVPLSTKLTVKVTTYHSSALSATVTAKGKLDVLNLDSAITYTVKLKNCTGPISGVSLSGQDGELFRAETNESGNVILTLKEGEDYATNKTYKVSLDMLVCGQTVSKTISFKVTQSALKLTATPSTLTCYQAIGYCATTLKLTSPATAEIADVTLSTKTATAFQKALGEEGMIFNPDTGRITFELAHPGLLTPGKSYTVYLDVTPQNAATNVKPTQIKLTVKVQK